MGVMPTLDEMIARADRLAAESQLLAEDLRAFKALQTNTGRQRLKRDDGRLTDEGVRVLNVALQAGKTPSEIARMLEISVPAVLYRKEMAAQSRRRSRR